jgi:hypothetical protein
MTFKRTFCCLLALWFCAALPSHAQDASKPKLGPPLNPNGGFEEGKANYDLTQPTRSFIDNDEVYRGQASLRLEGEGATERRAFNIADQGVAIPTPGANTQYVMRFALKAKNVDPKFPPSVQFRCYDANRKSFQFKQQESAKISIGKRSN